MAYKKTEWVNNLPPSIDEVNLGKMEEQIYQNSLRIEDIQKTLAEHASHLSSLDGEISGLKGRMTTAENDIKGIKQDITNINNTKANKADVPTNSDFATQLATKVDKTTYNTFANTTVPNTYAKKSDVYTKGETDSRLNNKLSKSGDTGSGNYTFNNNVTVKGDLSTNKSYVIHNGAKLYIQSGNPGGKKGDIWIKNS